MNGYPNPRDPLVDKLGHITKNWFYFLIGNYGQQQPTITSDTTITSGGFYRVDCSSGTVNISLSGSALSGAVTFKKVDASANTVEITPTVGLIDGLSTLTIGAQYVSYTLYPSDSNWWII